MGTIDHIRKKIASWRHFNKAVIVSTSLAVLTVLVGLSLNPFVGNWQYVNNHLIVTISSILLLVGTAFLAALIMIVGSLIHKRKPKLDEFLGAFVMFVFIPMGLLGIVAFTGGTVATILLSVFGGYLLLFLTAYLASKIWS